MKKTCSRCGRIHDVNYTCNHNRPKRDYSKYGNLEERKARNTQAWANKSVEIREAAHYLCEVCRDKGIYNYKDIEVHHITKLRDNPDGLLDNDNLICLCVAHHKMADRGQIDKKYLLKLAHQRECR